LDVVSLFMPLHATCLSISSDGGLALGEQFCYLPINFVRRHVWGMRKTMRDETDWDLLWAEITEAFSPGAPIKEHHMLAGRETEKRMLVDAVLQRGKHAAVYGERGVGKTSLANTFALPLNRPTSPLLFVRTNCVSNDTFSAVWRRVFRRLSYDNTDANGDGARRSLSDDYHGDITPDDVAVELSSFSANCTPVIVLDEFDQVRDVTVHTLLANTLKLLSDETVYVTIIIVGVAEDIDALIAEHGSIPRSLMQVKMPRLPLDELATIVAARLYRLGIKISSNALWQISFLSRGLPYYAHLIGMHTARQVAQKKRRKIEERDVDEGISLRSTRDRSHNSTELRRSGC
jgi:Cdc6-like AAA superfamily ATPase